MKALCCVFHMCIMFHWKIFGPDLWPWGLPSGLKINSEVILELWDPSAKYQLHRLARSWVILLTDRQTSMMNRWFFLFHRKNLQQSALFFYWSKYISLDWYSFEKFIVINTSPFIHHGIFLSPFFNTDNLYLSLNW